MIYAKKYYAVKVCVSNWAITREMLTYCTEEQRRLRRARAQKSFVYLLLLNLNLLIRHLSVDPIKFVSVAAVRQPTLKLQISNSNLAKFVLTGRFDKQAERL